MAGEVIEQTNNAEQPFETGDVVENLESKSVMYREDINKAKEQFTKTLDDVNARLKRLVTGQTLGEKFENMLDAIGGDNQEEFDQAVSRVDKELNTLEGNFSNRLARIEADFEKNPSRYLARDAEITNLLSDANADLENLLATRVEAIAVAQETLPGSDVPEEAIAYAEAEVEEAAEGEDIRIAQGDNAAANTYRGFQALKGDVTAQKLKDQGVE
ncbi:hypothetical protein KKA95_04070 [Patescibacteria group bacterium]|nr:hypothetical protein [Patescibacteria group bacterium]